LSTFGNSSGLFDGATRDAVGVVCCRSSIVACGVGYSAAYLGNEVAGALSRFGQAFAYASPARISLTASSTASMARRSRWRLRICAAQQQGAAGRK
jgi:hypothetical protein